MARNTLSNTAKLRRSSVVAEMEIWLVDARHRESFALEFYNVMTSCGQTKFDLVRMVRMPAMRFSVDALVDLWSK